MVMRIPEHLEHLKRDARGRPVPYINTWGPWEDVSRNFIKYDKSVATQHEPETEAIAWHFRDDPAGEPDFAHRSPQRQRQCMVYRRCQVCTRPLDWGFTWLVISTASVEWMSLAGTQDVAVVVEPWLCPDCRDFATRHCPGLIRRRSAHDFTTVQIKHPDEIQLVVTRGAIEGPMAEATREHPVVLWSKVYVFNMDLVRRTRHSGAN